MIKRLLSFFEPAVLARSQRYTQEWLELERKKRLITSRFFMCSIALLYLLHYPLVDIPAHKTPLDLWLTFRIEVASVSVLAFLFTFIRGISNSGWSWVPIFISVAFTVFMQGQAMLWRPQVPFFYLPLLAFVGTIAANLGLGGSIFLYCVVLIIARAPFFVSSESYQHLISASIVGFFFILIFRSTQGLQFRNFILEHEWRNHYEIISQVAHDIRSPVALVNAIIASASGLSDGERDSLKRAVKRINSIANDVLQSSRSAVGEHFFSVSLGNSEKFSLAYVASGVVDEFRDRVGFKLELRTIDDSFVDVPKAQFERSLSNLIQNSIESYEGQGGLIQVLVSKEGLRSVISVIDYGKGIAHEVIGRVGDRGFSFGKSGGDGSGNGLGVHSAREFTNLCGGSLKIDSALGRGTTVKLELPIVEPPSWFVSKVEFSHVSRVVCLDDSSDILNSYKKLILHPQVLCLKSVAELTDYCRMHLGEEGLYFIDHDLGECITGLDLIEMFALGRQAYLVTGLAFDEAVQRRCEKAGCKLIPKDQLTRVLT